MIAAACTSVRTFTATSSQGLLYAHEQLHRASRERMPLVAVNVNRSILAPWSLETDLADSMSQRDTGWIQLYCSSTQEVMDSVLCAYRIAETTMLPVLEPESGAWRGRCIPSDLARPLPARVPACPRLRTGLHPGGALRVPSAADGQPARPHQQEPVLTARPGAPRSRQAPDSG